MLFKILFKTLIPSFVMWIEGGDTGLGTGGETVSTPAVTETVVTETPPAQGQPSTEQPSQPNQEFSASELLQLREENKRLKAYNEFIRQTGGSQNQQVQAQQQQQQFDLAPDEVPYVSDVDKLVDMKLNGLKLEMERERVANELVQTANSIRATDPNFDKRMELAAEYIERDEFAASQFDRARTAKEKIAVLEKIARFHPLYDSIQPHGLPAGGTNLNDVAQRIQANSQIPPVLNNLQTSPPVEPSWSTMDAETYKKKFAEIIKGY